MLFSIRQIDLLHSFNIRMLNMSWSWGLLESRFWINVAITSLVKVTVEIDSSVFLQILEGSSLELFIIEHCLAKKQLNSSAFFLSRLHIYSDEREEVYKELLCCLTAISILTSKFLHKSSDPWVSYAWFPLGYKWR